MARERRTEVLVVGAGPVGLLSALVLADRGIAVEVVDQAWRPATHGFALALHPRSLELLDNLGMAEELISNGQRIDAIGFYEGTDRQAGLDLGDLDAKFPFVLALPQRELEAVLQARLRKRRVKIRWNHRVSDLEDLGGEVVATVDKLDRVSGGYPVATRTEVVAASSVVRADYAIGADGHHSLVRRKLGLEFEHAGDAGLFGVFEFAAELEAPGEMRVILGAEGCGGLWPLAGGRCRLSFELQDAPQPPPLGSKRSVTAIGQHAYPEIAVERLEELVKARAPWFDTPVEEVLWSVAVGFERRMASSLGQGRVWLAGDAAHVMYPVGMHSMNLGLEEACQLASAIAGRLRGDASESIFEFYQRERSDELRLILGQEELAARAEASEWVRDRRGPILECLPSCGDELVQLLTRLGLERMT